MSALIKLEHLGRIYPVGTTGVPALQDVSLEIQPGEFVAVLGASGSGKSTLMNIIGCLDCPTSGRYLFGGVAVSGLGHDELADIRNRRIGFVFQNFNLLPRTSALRNVELPMLYAPGRLSSRERRARAEQALARVGLANRADHHPNQLSGGQQQRVALARALVNQPDILLADEPTGNLDSRTSAEMMGVFRDLNQRGMTIVMVTHELAVAGYARRNIAMRDGQLISDSPVTARFDSPDELQRGKPTEPDLALTL